MTTNHLDTAVRPHRRGRWILRMFFVGVVLLLLFASLAFNFGLYHELKLNYAKLSEGELDPYGLKHPNFPADSPAGKAGGDLPVVLFFGDSRARGWPTPTVSGYRFVNRGIAGQTTAQVLGRVPADLTPLSPRVVVVQAGINDLKAIGLLPHRRDEIVADCKANLRQIIGRAKEQGATVVVTTIFPPGKVPLARQMVWSPETEKGVEEVNADLRNLASERVIILDAWKLLEDHGQLHEGYGLDTLHLNATGYGVLSPELDKFLRTLPPQRAGS